MHARRHRPAARTASRRTSPTTPGGSSTSETTRWVSGAEAIPRRTVEREDLVLVPDAEEHAPGSTAQILVQAPFATGTGLVVTDRGPITSTATFAVVDGSAIVPIEVGEADVPNINVSVEVAGSAPRRNPDGTPVDGAPDRPAFATGSVTLPVSTAEPHARRHRHAGGRAARTRRGDDARRRGRTGPTARRPPVPTSSSSSSTRPSWRSAATSWPTVGVVLRPPADRCGHDVRARRHRARRPGAAPRQPADRRRRRAPRPRRPRPPARSRTAPPATPDGKTPAGSTPPTWQRVQAAPSAAAPPIAVRSNFDAVALFAPDVTTDADGRATVDVDAARQPHPVPRDGRRRRRRPAVRHRRGQPHRPSCR